MPADGLAVLLRSFRLPTMAAIWEESVGRAERESWGYMRFLRFSGQEGRSGGKRKRQTYATNSQAL
jgi:hypothetical protein